MKIQLNIKGDRNDAANAFVKFGLNGYSQSLNSFLEIGNNQLTCCFDFPEEYKNEVFECISKWFLKEEEIIPGYGYENGSLLYYTEH